MVLTIVLGCASTLIAWVAYSTGAAAVVPFPDHDRLVSIRSIPILHTTGGVEVLAEYSALPQFQGFSLYYLGAANVGGPNGRRLDVALIDHHFFAVGGIYPALGRAFGQGESRFGSTAIVSQRLWQSQGAPALTPDYTIELNGVPYVVVGVMPLSFQFPGRTQVWVPFPGDTQLIVGYPTPRVFARLIPSATAGAAAAVLSGLNNRRQSEGPIVVPLEDPSVKDARPVLSLLKRLGALLMTATCMNLISLWLMRGFSRLPNLAVKSALGASRGTLVRDQLSESLPITLSGLAAAIGAGIGIGHVVVTRVADYIPALGRAVVTADVLVLTIGCPLLATLIASVWPAFAANWSVRSSQMAGNPRATTPAGSVIVVPAIQIAIVVSLSSTALAVLHGTRTMADGDGFYAAGNATMFEITLPRVRYGTEAAVAEFVDRIEDEWRSVSTDSAVGLTNFTPRILNGRSTRGVRLARGNGEAYRGVAEVLVSDGYFDAVGIHLMAGRRFERLDGRGGRSLILSCEAARLLAPEPADLIGSDVIVDSEALTVVGITGEGGGLAAYRPLRRAAPPASLVVAVGQGNPVNRNEKFLQEFVWRVDPSVPIYNVSSLAAALFKGRVVEWLALVVCTACATIALVLCAGGVYSAAAAYGRVRLKEMAIRLLLGANGKVLWTGGVLRAGLASTCVAGAAALIHRQLFRAAFVYEYGSVPDASTWMLVSSVAIVVLSTMGATALALKGMSRLDPAALLRQEM